MARRIDIELTSARPDGTWTWRAAGAMKPRGVVDGHLVAGDAKAGDVLRAEADFEVEGITIVSVSVPKGKKQAEPERIELLASAAPTGGVTTQLVGRGDRRPSDRRRDRDDNRGDGRGGRARPPGDRGAPDGTGGSRPAARRTGREGDTGRGPREGRPTADRAGGERTERSGAERPAGDRARSGAPSGDRRRTGPPGASESRAARGRPTRPVDADAGDGPERTAARRLNPGNVHRQAVMASLSPEQQPIAEQVLRGGIPAVRTAIHLERDKAIAEGRTAPNSDSLLAMAEEVLPRLKAAEWRDRAEAAAKAGENLSLRDLRSVVTGADLARDDDTRKLAADLREALEARLTKMREEWTTEIVHQLDEGRVVRALRLAARPPEATTRLTAEHAERLASAASAAMSPETAPDRWAALLEAVAASPVRRAVGPAGLPPEPGAALLSAAQQQVGRIPSLAALLGISMPPPPGPARPPAPGNRPPRRPPSPTPPAGPTPPVADGPAPAEPTSPVADEPTVAEPAPSGPVTTEPTSPVVDGEPVVEPSAAEAPVTGTDDGAPPLETTEAAPEG